MFTNDSYLIVIRNLLRKSRRHPKNEQNKKIKKFEKTFKKVLTKPKRCGIITTSLRERVKNNKEPKKKDEKIV